MSTTDAFRVKARAALLAGEIFQDAPPVVGGPRWGISAVLRPRGPVVSRLRELQREAVEVAGPGHWVHGDQALHTTLRAFEPHSTRSLADDPRFAEYVAAVDEAAKRTAPITMELRGVVPFSGGILAPGDGGSDALPNLRLRLVEALSARGIRDRETGFVRDQWYVTLIHFGAVVPDPAALVAWGDRNRDQFVGTVRYEDVEIIRWRLLGGAITPEPVYRAVLSG